MLSVTDPLGVSVTYGYDLLGNQLDMTDGRGKVTRYRYGAFGLVTQVINPSNQAMSYRYDLALQTAELTDRNGNHTRYRYDNRGQLVEKAVAETEDRIQYAYDEVGNRASMTDSSGQSSYAYDGNNRLLEVAKDGKVQLTYTYDAVGNVKSLTDKTGFTTSYTYDKSSRMSTVTGQGKTTSYSYDENGNRTSIAYAGGVQENYTFDRNSQLLKLVNTKADGAVLSEYSYTYDLTGNQLTKTDSYGATNYGYDEVGRIVKAEAPGKTTVFTYDRSGNRQSMLETYTSEQPTGYTDPISKAELTYIVKRSEYMYSNANELLQLTEQMKDAAGEEVLEKKVISLFDNNGNEVRQQTSYLRPHSRGMNQVTGANPYGDEQTEEISSLLEKVNNTFDGLNRLTQAINVQGGERSTVEYAYDGDDLRTQKTVRSSADGYAEQVTNYLYDRQYVILETDKADAVSVRYVKGINYIARIDQADKLSYFLFNGHGDVVQTVDEQGTIENQYDYDVFGSPTLTIELYESTIRYSGEFYDAEVGLYYLRARYYDPYVGRFISEDTYRGRSDKPLSLNLYTYVLNNPLIFIDPTGHAETSLRELAGATGSTIVFDAQTKKTTVTLVDGYSVVFDPNQKDKNGNAIVTIKNGRVMIENKTFDQMMTGSRTVKDGTIYAKIDSTVVSAVKDKNGKVTEVGKVAVVTVVAKQSNKYTTGSNNLPELKMTTLRNSTVIYDTTNNNQVLSLRSVFDLPAYLQKPIKSGDLTLSYVALVGYAMRDGEISADEKKQLNLNKGQIGILETSAVGEQNGMTLGQMSYLYGQQYPTVNFMAVVGIGGLKIGQPVSAPMTVVNKGKGKTTTTGKKTPSGGCNCFTAGTKVLTDEGEKNIEDIEVGDRVLAKSEYDSNGELAYKEVTALYRNQRDDIIKLHVGEQVIETTDNHPFWIEGKGWVFADELQVGDKLQKADGSNLMIDKIEFVKLDEPVTVYNFTVADYHTYYVTDLGIWVHNTEGCLRPEAKYLKSGKHGVKWTEGPATAKSTGKPQGQWSKEDLEFAGTKASTLEKGQGAWFDLPPGSTSVVHMPDGTTVPATRMWVRNNGTGTFHGYPAP
ncbi:intein C-terminal splicing region/intein N-terminal splicing region/RHS repeat-associated core domain-containing protein [Paenibacillus algorifonticola]|uniref:Intein C-terminal splicing region/intein N-terminal splicing region/RHS repeat-associated core domain-containing protein n=3 Tax=Paenibacillus algorifonticola TaxID=684063 RepID=A0A1I2ID49_9BACL|nr:intein C-terminal splicing region/intein N-terminal splicing region/RHS repeat-associated core domain-containing protein [Paenibacillus algorifonticola]